VLGLLAPGRAVAGATLELASDLTNAHAETAEHLAACGRVVLSLGRALGWCGPGLDRLALAGLLHDIGKVAVPPAVLAKPGALTAAERQLVEGHVEIGARLLDATGLPELDLATEVAFHHHEWWNGAGYPSALAGEDIPWAARIVAVVDVWDALRRERSYRLCLDEESALAVLRHGAGAQFDPLVVDCFVELDPAARDLAPIADRLEPFPRLVAT
jgi:putative nucleotidyltransferase with HDIG domain